MSSSGYHAGDKEEESSMKTTMMVLSFVLMLCTGCASLQRVELGQKEEWIAVARKDLVASEATVTTREGRTHEGKIVQLNADSLWLQPELCTSPIAFGLDRVSSIQPSRNSGAPVVGVVAGILLGGAIGAGIGENAAPDRVEGDLLGIGAAMGKGISTAAGAAVGAAIGGVSLGAILGYCTSVTDYYISYSPPPRTAAQPAPPLPGSARTGK
jgi:hypothetical protein